MNAVKPTTIEIAGVERNLRFTLGARRRIHDAFGMDFRDALNKYDAAAFPEILHALMHDEKGKPPDIGVDELAEMLPAGDSPEIMGAIIAAASNGRLEKNEAAALVMKAMESENESTGSNSSPSLTSASESPTAPNSTGDSLNANSTPSSSATSSENGSSTTDPESAQPQPTT